MTTNSPNRDVQALIGLCKIEIKRWKAASEANPNMRYMVTLMETALAALAAEPVALRYRHINDTRWKLEKNTQIDERLTNVEQELLYTTPPAQILRPVELPDEQSRHQLPKLPDPVTAQDMKESLNIPMFQEEAECAASAFNQCLMECQPVYVAAKRIKGALDECMKEMDSMQESINYKYKTLIKWRNRAIELEEEVQRLNASAQPVSDGWVRSARANDALIMLDRIGTVDPADDDRIDEIKRIIKELAAAPGGQDD